MSEVTVLEINNCSLMCLSRFSILSSVFTYKGDKYKKESTSHY